MLGVAEVGIDDNFFALGGDSIMSIQLVSRARRAGLAITPRAVFQHQTVASLAAVATARAPRRPRRGAADIAVGELPATPIMRWLARARRADRRFSQAMLLTVPAGLGDRASVRRAADACSTITTRCGCGSTVPGRDVRDRTTCARHPGGSGSMPRGSVAARDCVRRVDIAGLDAAARQP